MVFVIVGIPTANGRLDTRKNLKTAMVRNAILFYGVTILILTACISPQQVGGGEPIAPSQLAERIQEGSAPLILDVRTPEEFAEGHVPGAVHPKNSIRIATSQIIVTCAISIIRPSQNEYLWDDIRNLALELQVCSTLPCDEPLYDELLYKG